METIITYFGQDAKVNCDENCNKAWGVDNRPQNKISDNPDDWEYLSDKELDNAPINPGTYEGDDAKPINKEGIPNKWCVRQCERCNISSPGESKMPLEIIAFN